MNCGPMPAPNPETDRRRRARRPAAAHAEAARPSRRPRRHPAGGGDRRRAPATARSISAPASAPPGWRSRVRVPGVDVTLVEIDPELAAHRRREHRAQRPRPARSGRDASTSRRPPTSSQPAGCGRAAADHVLMNPPFNDPARQNVSPDPGRRAGACRRRGMLAGWMPRPRRAAFGRNADADLAGRRACRRACRARRRLRRHHGAAGPRRAGQPAIRVLVRAAQGQPRAARAAAGADAQR